MRYHRAELKIRLRFSAAIDALLERHGVLLLPAPPDLPPTLEEARDPLFVVNLTRLLWLFNLSGHPALVLPVGEIDARPVALQLVGRKGHERALLEFRLWKYCRVEARTG